MWKKKKKINKIVYILKTRKDNSMKINVFVRYSNNIHFNVLWSNFSAENIFLLLKTLGIHTALHNRIVLIYLKLQNNRGWRFFTRLNNIAICFNFCCIFPSSMIKNWCKQPSDSDPEKKLKCTVRFKNVLPLNKLTSFDLVAIWKIQFYSGIWSKIWFF